MRSFLPTSLRHLTRAALVLPVLLLGCAPSGGAPTGTKVAKRSAADTQFPNDPAAYDFFVSQGLTNFQAAGIVGNLDQESGVDPNAAQPGGPGVGIAQWSMGGRWDTQTNDNCLAYASQQGQSPHSLQVQLQFIWYELTTFPSYGLSDLRATTNVDDATVVFETKFEGCGQCDQSNRTSYAEAVLAAYGGAPPASPSPSSSCVVQADGLLHCDNQAHSAIHAQSNLESAIVDYLETTNSWFTCWGTGELHSGGNTTWYYTQGDDSGNWGWVPAVDLSTDSSFDANPTAAGLPACGVAGNPPGPGVSPSSENAVASIALLNVGNTACGTNSQGGSGFESSCTGNGGQPEYWCADFATWVWATAGADTTGLTAAAGSFYVYGQNNGTLSSTPHVGDAVVFDYQGGGYADHVAIVTQVDGANNIVTASGDWNGQSGSEAYFSSTSSVVVNQPAYPGVVGSSPGAIGMTISGFISPSGLPKAPPAQPAPGAEGSRAFLYPNQQHFLNADGAGNVRHHWWDAAQGTITSDTWGTGTVGQPVTLLDGTSQHVFARGTDGSLKHWFWDPVNGAGQDDWAPNAGLAGDPAAIMIGDFQDVWAVDGGGDLQHWYWGPSTNGAQQDTWGAGVVGRPSVLVTGTGEQHAFARGTGGTLEHWWWAPDQGISHDTWGSGLASDPSALAIGDFQDVWAVDGGGNLQHWYWGPSTNGVQQDTWGSGVVGRPSMVLYGNGDQEAFVRGIGGTLEHFWWDSQLGVSHDTWGTGLTQDPTAEIIDSQQHVWALDAAGHAQHWYWDPSTGFGHDDWGQ